MKLPIMTVQDLLGSVSATPNTALMKLRNRPEKLLVTNSADLLPLARIVESWLHETANGNVYTSRARINDLRELGSKAKLPPELCHPHTLRHTAVKKISDKYGILAGRSFAGHTNIITTRRYAETSNDELRCAIKSLSR